MRNKVKTQSQTPGNNVEDILTQVNTFLDLTKVKSSTFSLEHEKLLCEKLKVLIIHLQNPLTPSSSSILTKDNIAGLVLPYTIKTIFQFLGSDKKQKTKEKNDDSHKDEKTDLTCRNVIWEAFSTCLDVLLEVFVSLNESDDSMENIATINYTGDVQMSDSSISPNHNMTILNQCLSQSNLQKILAYISQVSLGIDNESSSTIEYKISLQASRAFYSLVVYLYKPTFDSAMKFISTNILSQVSSKLRKDMDNIEEKNDEIYKNICLSTLTLLSKFVITSSAESTSDLTSLLSTNPKKVFMSFSSEPFLLLFSHIYSYFCFTEDDDTQKNNDKIKALLQHILRNGLICVNTSSSPQGVTIMDGSHSNKNSSANNSGLENWRNLLVTQLDLWIQSKAKEENDSDNSIKNNSEGHNLPFPHIQRLEESYSQLASSSKTKQDSTNNSHYQKQCPDQIQLFHNLTSLLLGKTESASTTSSKKSKKRRKLSSNINSSTSISYDTDQIVIVLKFIPFIVQSFLGEIQSFQRHIQKAIALLSLSDQLKLKYDLTNVQFRFWVYTLHPVISKMSDNTSSKVSERCLKTITGTLNQLHTHQIYMPAYPDPTQFHFRILYHFVNEILRFSSKLQKMVSPHSSVPSLILITQVLHEFLNLNHNLIHDDLSKVISIIANIQRLIETDVDDDFTKDNDKISSFIQAIISTYGKLRQLIYFIQAVIQSNDSQKDCLEKNPIHGLLFSSSSGSGTRKCLQKQIFGLPFGHIPDIWDLLWEKCCASQNKNDMIVELFILFLKCIQIDNAVEIRKLVISSVETCMDTYFFSDNPDRNYDESSKSSIISQKIATELSSPDEESSSSFGLLLYLCTWFLEIYSRCNFWLDPSNMMTARKTLNIEGEDVNYNTFFLGASGTCNQALFQILSTSRDLLASRDFHNKKLVDKYGIDLLHLACYRIQHLHTVLVDIKSRCLPKSLNDDGNDDDFIKNYTKEKQRSKKLQKEIKDSISFLFVMTEHTSILSKITTETPWKSMAQNIDVWMQYCEPQHLYFFSSWLLSTVSASTLDNTENMISHFSLTNFDDEIDYTRTRIRTNPILHPNKSLLHQDKLVVNDLLQDASFWEIPNIRYCIFENTYSIITQFIDISSSLSTVKESKSEKELKQLLMKHIYGKQEEAEDSFLRILGFTLIDKNYGQGMHFSNSTQSTSLLNQAYELLKFLQAIPASIIQQVSQDENYNFLVTQNTMSLDVFLTSMIIYILQQEEELSGTTELLLNMISACRSITSNRMVALLTQNTTEKVQIEKQAKCFHLILEYIVQSTGKVLSLMKSKKDLFNPSLEYISSSSEILQEVTSYACCVAPSPKRFFHYVTSEILPGAISGSDGRVLVSLAPKIFMRSILRRLILLDESEYHSLSNSVSHSHDDKNGHHKDKSARILAFEMIHKMLTDSATESGCSFSYRILDSHHKYLEIENIGSNKDNDDDEDSSLISQIELPLLSDALHFWSKFQSTISTYARKTLFSSKDTSDIMTEEKEGSILSAVHDLCDAMTNEFLSHNNDVKFFTQDNILYFLSMLCCSTSTFFSKHFKDNEEQEVLPQFLIKMTLVLLKVYDLAPSYKTANCGDEPSLLLYSSIDTNSHANTPKTLFESAYTRLFHSSFGIGSAAGSHNESMEERVTFLLTQVLTVLLPDNKSEEDEWTEEKLTQVCSKIYCFHLICHSTTTAQGGGAKQLTKTRKKILSEFYSRHFLFQTCNALHALFDRKTLVVDDKLDTNIRTCMNMLLFLITHPDIIKLSSRDIALILATISQPHAPSSEDKHSRIRFFGSSCKITSFLLKGYTQKVYTCIPVFVSTLTSLLLDIISFHPDDQTYIVNPKAELFTKLCESLKEHKEVFKKHIIGLLLTFSDALVVSPSSPVSTFLPKETKAGGGEGGNVMNLETKKAILPAIYALLDLCSSFEIDQLNFLMSSLSSSTSSSSAKVMFRKIYQGYQKQSYKGQF